MSTSRIGAEGDALVRALRERYAPRLAGLFWDQRVGKESRLVLRLTGQEPVENKRMTVCREPLTIVFTSGQLHTREQLEKLHNSNLVWLRAASSPPAWHLSDERTGEIVLEI